MEKTIVLPGSVRAKKNSRVPIYVGGRNVPRRLVIIPSRAYRNWEAEARCAARQQWAGEPISGDVSMSVLAYVKGKKPDLSGVLESVGDCLQGIVYLDDAQIYSWDGSRVYHDRQMPRTVVTIRWGG